MSGGIPTTLSDPAAAGGAPNGLAETNRCGSGNVYVHGVDESVMSVNGKKTMSRQ